MQLSHGSRDCCPEAPSAVRMTNSAAQSCQGRPKTLLVVSLFDGIGAVWQALKETAFSALRLTHFVQQSPNIISLTCSSAAMQHPSHGSGCNPLWPSTVLIFAFLQEAAHVNSSFCTFAQARGMLKYVLKSLNIPFFWLQEAVPMADNPEPCHCVIGGTAFAA